MVARNFITVPGEAFNASGAGAVERTVQDKLRDVVSVKDFGAVGDGVADDTAAFTAALAAADNVTVPSGVYAINGTITLLLDKALILDSKVTLKRFSSLSASTAPVVYLAASRSSLVGAGFESSTIETQNACPDGVVKLGLPDMSSAAGNVEKCRIEGVGIKGPTLYGQTSGSPDVCLHIVAPEVTGGGFCYYHILHKIGVYQANIGIWFHGYANGIFADTIYGVHIGNTSLAPAAFIYIHGALDNTVSNIFFNQSNDSTGILVDSLDNRANGSPTVMDPNYNSFTGIVCEQGGASAKAIDVKAGARSYYQIIDNTAAGFAVYANFGVNKNTLHTSVSTRLPDLYVDGVTRTESNVYVGKDAADLSVDGVQLLTNNSSAFTSTSAVPLFLNRKTSQGAILGLRYDGTAIASLAISSARASLSSSTMGIGINPGGSSILPLNDALSVVDNTISMGASGARWSEVYAGTGTINTSDEREKQDIEELSAAELRVAARLKSLVKKFKFVDAVGAKGNDARIHVGVVAQEVVAAFETENLDPMRYGIVCYDEWDAEFDEEGVEVTPAGNRYGIRYEELLAFVIAAL